MAPEMADFEAPDFLVELLLLLWSDHFLQTIIAGKPRPYGWGLHSPGVSQVIPIITGGAILAVMSANTMPATIYDPFVRGPFPAGVQTFELHDAARGRTFPCEVWYPASPQHAG